MHPFSRSLRSLESDHSRRPALGLLAAALMLGAWAVWFFGARIGVYEVSDAARLEADRVAFSLEAPASGRVVANRLALDREVKAGEVLVELDPAPDRLAVGEQRARLASLRAQLPRLRQEIAARRRALLEARQAAGAALDEARAQFREADAAARLAEDQAGRAERLFAKDVLSEVEQRRARSEAETRRAAATGRELGLSRLEREQSARQSERMAELGKLERDAAELEGDIATGEASVLRLEQEVERRVIRAPVDGRLAAVADLRIGSLVREGIELGSLVPRAALRAVADFAPPQALGRIRTGQRAQMRLEGFPWTQYGSLPLRVVHVASEPHDNRLRVELAIQAGNSRIPIQHGLAGTVEVEVARCTPATLVLRAAGRLLAAPVGRDGPT
ncbi:MAG TPA: HlyD family efflux transporter periplasmic adaptor subunit [Candidatus Eisenbacteria bacterium]|jgi:membrane fusion protein (multidrug efflux system)